MSHLEPVRRTAATHTTADRDGAFRRARPSVLAALAAAGAFGLILLAAPCYGQTPPPNEKTEAQGETTTAEYPMVLQTLTVRKEGAVLFADIAAPPMNLLGPELVRDLVSLIRRAETDDAVQVLVFRSTDPDYFISHVDVTRIKEYLEEALGRLPGDLTDQ